MLKNAAYLRSEIEVLLSQCHVAQKRPQWTLNFDYALGGFAKTNHDLFQFMDQFRKVSDIVLEPIYTGKMMFGIYDLIKQGHFKRGERIVALHTGGLQGLRGFANKDDTNG